jgi:DNA-directed RNA polymerase III subunit RPC6
MTVLNRCLKSLETKNYIKPTKTVKFPNRKTYMLAHLQPSEAATGGAFYTDGILDEEFVHQMATWTEKYVIGRSWWHPPMNEGGRKKDKAKLSRQEAERLRALELERGQVTRDRSEDMLPMLPGFQGYPTLSEITRAINASGLSGVIMREAEMGQLLDVLRWDGKIEKIPDSKGYKAVRQVGAWDGANVAKGVTEAPCGRCPVFDICEDNGPVNAKTCEYFEDWLNVL